jgi:hypothetical protein
MDKKVLCPYCGSEMIGQNVTQVFGVYWAQAKCEHCKSTGPLICGERGLVTDAEEMARKSALSAAQARYLPPNRPLTLEEVKALDRDDMGYSCVWMENRRVYDANGQAYEDYPYPVVTAECIPNSQAYYKKYGIEYRAWLRKPTQAEMDAAGWGE